MRILWPRSGRRVYYFAFGANLSADVLEHRRIRVFEALDYVLQDAALRFSLPGFYRDQGYASADAALGEVVYGRMYLILERDAKRMDYFEGVPFLRAHEKVWRKENDLDFFYYRANRRLDDLRPTREYLDYLLDAYREMENVPQAYIELLAATDTLDEFLPPNQTGDFVEDIERWPAPLHRLLIYYEGCCLRLVEFLWNRSLLQWMIRI